jgi:hypothetical protein
MTTAAEANVGRPADLIRHLVRTGLMAALVFALSADVMQFQGRKECRGSDFSSGFSRDFDVGRCDFVVKRIGGAFEMHFPLSR